MRKPFILLMLIFPSIILAQFEQKLSINLSAGPFKTIGSKDYVPYEDYPNEYWPYQMSNFKTGITGDLGFQFNLNRHLSLCIEVGLMYSGGWYYSLADDGTNWLDWTLYQYDTTDVVLETGSNEMTFFNLSFGLASKYYILPNRKINPYIFAGIMLNFTTVNYTNNYWQARKDHDMLAPDDTYPTNDFLEENTGIGFNPGLGAEYNLNDKIGFFISAGYYFIFLKEENFKLEEQRQNKENFHSINFNAGIRFSFLKSKNL